MKPGTVRKIHLASILAGGNIRAVSKMLRLSVRVLRPVAYRLLIRGLWGSTNRR